MNASRFQRVLLQNDEDVLLVPQRSMEGHEQRLLAEGQALPAAQMDLDLVVKHWGNPSP